MNPTRKYCQSLGLSHEQTDRLIKAIANDNITKTNLGRSPEDNKTFKEMVEIMKRNVKRKY